MVEKGKNGFRDREFVEADSLSKGMVFVFSSNIAQAKKRANNRKMIEEGQGVNMPARFGTGGTSEIISNNGIEVVSKRRSRGGSHQLKKR